MRTVWMYALVLLLGVFGEGMALAGGMTHGKGAFTLDVEYERFDADMDLVSTTRSITLAEWNGWFEVPYERDAVMVTASYGIRENIDILFSLGCVEDELVADSRTGAETNHTLKGDSNPVWKIGVKFDFFRSASGAYLGGAASYSQWDSGDDAYFSSPGSDPTRFETECTEYAVSLHAGKKWGAFSPWVGVEYTEVEIEQTLGNYQNGIPGPDFHDYELDDNVGAIVGLIWEINDKVDATVKGRLINQNSWSLGVGYRF